MFLASPGGQLMKRVFVSAVLMFTAASVMSAQTLVNKHSASEGDTLILSRSIYTGTAATVTVGQTLPPGCVAGTVTLPKIPSGTTTVAVTCATATSDGTYPTVFDNDKV